MNLRQLHFKLLFKSNKILIILWNLNLVEIVGKNYSKIKEPVLIVVGTLDMMMTNQIEFKKDFYAYLWTKIVPNPNFYSFSP